MKYLRFFRAGFNGFTLHFRLSAPQKLSVLLFIDSIPQSRRRLDDIWTPVNIWPNFFQQNTPKTHLLPRSNGWTLCSHQLGLKATRSNRESLMIIRLLRNNRRRK